MNTASEISAGTSASLSRPSGSRGPTSDSRGRTTAIEVTGLTKRYRDVTAVADVTFAVEAGTITGLLGRNGAGKTTIMSLLTGQAFPTSGQVRVFGQEPLENDAILAQVCFVKESQRYPDSFRVHHILTAASHFHVGWDRELADSLIADFDLPRRRHAKKLSRGMASAVGIVVGLASRAPITIFDEPYLGLDATARHHFYDMLLRDGVMQDHAGRPRTILLSSHLIDEVGALLEHVLVVDHGRLVIDAPADSLRGSATTLVGNRVRVDEVAAGLTVTRREALGSLASVTVHGPLSEGRQRRAAELGVELQQVSLQQLVMQAGTTATDTATASPPSTAHPSSAHPSSGHPSSGHPSSGHLEV